MHLIIALPAPWDCGPPGLLSWILQAEGWVGVFFSGIVPEAQGWNPSISPWMCAFPATWESWIVGRPGEASDKD